MRSPLLRWVNDVPYFLCRSPAAPQPRNTPQGRSSTLDQAAFLPNFNVRSFADTID